MSGGAVEGAPEATSPLATPALEAIPTAAQLASGPLLTPEKILFFYSPADWEQFVLEWAHALEEDYSSVKQFGGSGDRGIDVAGMLTTDGLRGEWDCYQCKHYAESLAPSDVWPEICKIFVGVSRDAFTMPRKYRLLAPKGCGPKLEKLLSDPPMLQAAFLAELDKPESAARGVCPADLFDKVRALAAATSFALFDSESMEEVLAVHSGTAHHLRRFGGALPSRPPVGEPPAEPDAKEARYVEQLMEAYSDAFEETFTPAVASSHPETSEHYPRQREAFYSAEALRLFARDYVPVGTFESLQSEIHDGVVDVCLTACSDGLTRLERVTAAATSLQLISNALVSVLYVRDRKGVVHQLANDDRLVWVRS